MVCHPQIFERCVGSVRRIVKFTAVHGDALPPVWHAHRDDPGAADLQLRRGEVDVTDSPVTIA
jgi:hypothetical protein